MRLIGNVEKDAQVRAVASGALPSGDAVIVNSDGTVSVVEETSTSVTQNLGSEVNFPDSAEIWHTDAAYDESAQKVVVAYRDRDNSNYGKAVVGTVSGTSISFGTPVTFQSTSTSLINIVYDSTNEKIVIGYENAGGSNYGTVIVGTVSGTSITFGSAVVFNSRRTAQSMDLVHDPNAGKTIIFYSDDDVTNAPYMALVGTVSGNSISFGSAVTVLADGQGDIRGVYDPNTQNIILAYRSPNPYYGKAKVATVSGDSMSFGSEVTFHSSSTYNIAMEYDTAHQKVVVVFSDLGNSGYGTAIVGTVSGNSISFGSAAVFVTSSTSSGETHRIRISYHVAAETMIVNWTDSGDSNTGKLVEGTVSGTSISFGTIVEFETQETFYQAATYDPDTKQVAIAWENDPQDTGKAFMFRPAYTVTTTNLTAENFLGFAAHTYADTQSALVNSTCTVDRNQSGLTAGQTYYVQADGSLGTTAADPSVVAGTAISSTEIIVKG